MRITVEVSAYYDWEPMPEDAVKALQADEERLKAALSALKVKTSIGDELLQKVLVEEPSHTDIGFPESEVLSQMIHVARSGGWQSRAQVVAEYIGKHTMKHHAHSDHVEKVSVQDDGPADEALCRACLVPYVDGAEVPMTKEEQDDFVTRYLADKSSVEKALNAYYETEGA